MIDRIRTHLTYANVMATLAVFIALGGTGYAALKIGSDDVKNNSLRSKDIRNNTLRGKDLHGNTLTGREVLESKLRTVPRATDAFRSESAAKLGSLTPDDLKVKCPAGTAMAAGGCFELVPRAAEVHNSAARTCGRDGRRLPTFGELLGFFQTQPPNLAAAGELTANVFGDDSNMAPPAGELYVVVMTSETGSSPAYLPAAPAGNSRQYRCVATPLN